MSHDLRTGAQTAPDYRRLAPQGLVPALEMDGQTLTQSLAIFEWLEEAYPEPPLLPESAIARAQVRSMAAIVACDIHPLNNLRVLKALKHDLGAPQSNIDAWVGRWIAEGFAALEETVVRHGDGFCFGDRPTIADCCLIPQIYNAHRFDIDLSAFPRLVAVDARCATIDAFVRAVPDRQPDADGAAS